MSYLGLNLKSEGSGKNTKTRYLLEEVEALKSTCLHFPGGSVVGTPILLVQGAGVQSLGRELRSPVRCSMAKNK